jgi:hypothetical protein
MAVADVGKVTLKQLATELEALRRRVAELEAKLTVGPAVVSAVAAPVVAKTTIAPTPPADGRAEVQALVTAMFAAVVAARPENPDREAVEADFEQYRVLVHTERKNSPLLNQDLFRYKWLPLCRRLATYLADVQDPTSFCITQWAPEAVDARTETVRLFLRADKRMPVPLQVRRDPQAGGQFRVDQSSL